MELVLNLKMIYKTIVSSVSVKSLHKAGNLKGITFSAVRSTEPTSFILTALIRI